MCYMLGHMQYLAEGCKMPHNLVNLSFSVPDVIITKLLAINHCHFGVHCSVPLNVPKIIVKYTFLHLLPDPSHV